MVRTQRPNFRGRQFRRRLKAAVPSPDFDEMKCCGTDHKSPFCPRCGKKLVAEAGLAGLLASCRATEAKSRKLAEKFAGGGARYRGGPAATEEDARKAKLVADKWKDWADALERLLYPDGQPD